MTILCEKGGWGGGGGGLSFKVFALLHLKDAITNYKTEIMGDQNFYIVIPGLGIFGQRNDGNTL